MRRVRMRWRLWGFIGSLGVDLGWSMILRFIMRMLLSPLCLLGRF